LAFIFGSSFFVAFEEDFFAGIASDTDEEEKGGRKGGDVRVIDPSVLSSSPRNFLN
jgi:hypothetical protein